MDAQDSRCWHWPVADSTKLCLLTSCHSSHWEFFLYLKLAIFLALYYMCVCTHCTFIVVCVCDKTLVIFLNCSLPYYFETGSLPHGPFLLHFHLPSRQKVMCCLNFILFLHVFIICVWGCILLLDTLSFYLNKVSFSIFFLIRLCRIPLMGEFPVGSILLELHFLQPVCTF